MSKEEAMAEVWRQLRIDGLKLQDGEDDVSKTFGTCDRCHKAPIRNYCYRYCPECFNEWLIEMGEEPREWVKGPDNTIVGKS